uniref:Uncharacterized protein n=1 Tax=Melopsittacus undulatus TaxID=13146 RepID=A0A8V5GMT1_MELUD
MRTRPVLTVLLVLALPLALSRRPPGPAQVAPSGGPPFPHSRSPPFPPRSPASPPAGDARPAAGAPESARQPRARDMHDFFVGLMGKRAAEPAGGDSGGRGSPV